MNRDDLTATARIRDAALELFPRDGFAATTIRSVAEAAGVSPGLVLHHFGSKEGLRKACDHYVVARFRETKLAAMEAENLSNSAFASSAFRVAPQLMGYFAWALVRGHSAAGELFDEMLSEAMDVTRVAVDKGMVRDSADLEMRTAVHMSMMLGMVVLHDHLRRSIGIDPLEAEGIAKLTPVLLEIFSGLFDPEILATFGETYAAGARDLAAAGDRVDVAP